MAFTYSFSEITASQTVHDAPVDQTLMDSIREDIYYLREWLGMSYYAGAVPDHDHDGVNSKPVNVTADQVGQSELKTGTASVTGSVVDGAVAFFVLVDYCFFPSTYMGGGATTTMRPYNSDGGDSVARFTIQNQSGFSQNYAVRYRYINASAGPKYAVLMDNNENPIMKIGFDNAPPDWESSIIKTAEANNLIYEMISKEDFDLISFE